METYMVMFMKLSGAVLCTTTAIMDIPLLEIMSEYVKPMEHGRVNNQHVVSMIFAYGGDEVWGSKNCSIFANMTPKFQGV